MSGDVSHVTLCSNIAAQIEQKAAGRRKRVRHGGTLCSSCYAEPPRQGQRYCLSCHSKRETARKKKQRIPCAGARALAEILTADQQVAE